MEVASGDPIFRYGKCFSLRPGSIGFRSCEKAGAIPAGKFWSYNPRPGLDTLDSYHLRDAIAVRAGDAWESAIVAQLVPAAEIH